MSRLLVALAVCLVWTFSSMTSVQACSCSCGPRKAWCKDSKVWGIDDETCYNECKCKKGCNPTCKGDHWNTCRYGCRINKVITDFRGIKRIGLFLCNPYPKGERTTDRDGGFGPPDGSLYADSPYHNQQKDSPNLGGGGIPGCGCSAKHSKSFDVSWFFLLFLLFLIRRKA